MGFRELLLHPEYRSRQDNIIKNFYTPVLRHSVIYKRAVGFFSSSALPALTQGLTSLFNNGGKFQIITSPRLTSEDIFAIKTGLNPNSNFLHSPNFKMSASSRLLSKLVADKKIEIKIALLEDDNNLGMFHEKFGLMYDSEGNVIAFSGSMNETANAFCANYESIDVFTSWNGDAKRVSQKQAAFEAMWKNCAQGIIVADFSEINFEILREYHIHKKPTIKKLTLNTAAVKIPAAIKLRDYQQKAIANWAKNSFVGIFDMTTGTGKTYTALAGVEKLFRVTKNNLAIVIICPYRMLVDQWIKNAVQFGLYPIACYSDSKKDYWLAHLKTSILSFNAGIQKYFCAIMTYATFAAEYTQNLLKKLHGNAVLIADEAHRLGTKNFSKVLPQNFPYRLALSATIERTNDPAGTKKIFDYFGSKCIQYNLRDAIENNMLAPYYYYPVPVSLDENELESYLALTAKITKSFHANKNLSDYTKKLLIQRARIIAGAKNKIDTLRRLIPKYKDDNQILIYCGDAKINKTRQIDIVTKMLGNEFGMRVKKFTCSEDAKSRALIKTNFEEGKHLQALVAIRCLDEGIDIPAVKIAFILASSTNYREYVQRRGRLLRKSPGKTSAVIFDFITLPFSPENLNFYDAKILAEVQPLIQKELLRLKDFSATAENPFDSDLLASDIKIKYRLSGIKEETKYDDVRQSEY